LPRGEFSANKPLDAGAVPVARSTRRTAICAAQVVLFVVMVAFITFVAAEPIITAPRPFASALDGSTVGIAAEDALEAFLAGLGAIVPGGAGHGERSGRGAPLWSPWWSWLVPLRSWLVPFLPSASGSPGRFSFDDG
jgi:hypothetical protein